MAKKRKKLTGKSKAQWMHVRRRCLQRTGVEMTHRLNDQLIGKISNGYPVADFVEKQSNRISVWDIKHEVNGEKIVFRAVYDKMRRNIVTILNNVEKNKMFLFDKPNAYKKGNDV